MASVAFTEFLPEVLPLVPGCSDILAVNAIRNSCIEFCSNTMYWQETQDAVDLTASDMPYPMTAPTGARVIQPLSVIVDGVPIKGVSIDYLDDNIVGWRDMQGGPRYYYQPDPDNIVLVPTPDTSYSVVLRVAYCPTRTGTTIYDWVYQNYLEALASGALARLCAMPGQSWSNPQVAQYHRQLFNDAMTDATIEANKAYNRGTLQVQMRGVR